MVNWKALIEAVGKVIAPAYPVEGISALLTALLQIEARETSLLNAIDLNVKALMEGPFHTGRVELGDALADSDDDTRMRMIESARIHFAEASGNARDAAWKSVCELHVAMCWLSQGKRQTA